MWPIKEKENKQLLILWPNLIPYSKLKECVFTVLLLTSTPLPALSHENNSILLLAAETFDPVVNIWVYLAGEARGNFPRVIWVT